MLCNIKLAKKKKIQCLVIVIYDLSFNIAGGSQNQQKKGKFWDRWSGHVGNWPVSSSHTHPQREHSIIRQDMFPTCIVSSICLKILTALGEYVKEQIKSEEERLPRTNKKNGGQLFSILPGDKEFCPLICPSTLSYCTQHFLPWIVIIYVGGFIFPTELLVCGAQRLPPSPSDPLSVSLALNRNPVTVY